MVDAYLLAGMIGTLALAAAFIVWDLNRAFARMNRDSVRWARRQSPLECEANLLWRIHRDREFGLAVALTIRRNVDRMNELITDTLQEANRRHMTIVTEAERPRLLEIVAAPR